MLAESSHWKKQNSAFTLWDWWPRSVSKFRTCVGTRDLSMGDVECPENGSGTGEWGLSLFSVKSQILTNNIATYKMDLLWRFLCSECDRVLVLNPGGGKWGIEDPERQWPELI